MIHLLDLESAMLLNLKTKAFIYRFSAIFGLRIYLAQREEEDYVRLHRMYRLIRDIIEDEDTRDDKAEFGILRGIWHASNGFTAIYTRNMSFKDSIVAKVKHAFDFDYNSW
jgi:hypothetical protein